MHRKKLFSQHEYDKSRNNISKDENVVVEHVTNLDDVCSRLFNETKKKHRNKHSYTEVVVVQNHAIEDYVKEDHVKEKKKKHKNKLASPESEEQIVGGHVANFDDVCEMPIKEKKNKHKNKCFSKENEGVVVHHNGIEESIKDHVKEKKNKLAFVASEEENVEECVANSDELSENRTKEKTKKHKKKCTSEEVIGAVTRHNVIEESVKVEHVKEKKKMHKKNIGDKGNEIENNTDVELEKVKHVKGKTKHKHKSTSLERKDVSFVIQQDVSSLNDNLAGHVIEVEAEGQEPVKEKKKRQKQNTSGEVNEIENNSNVESEKVEQVEKKKKRKHKSTSLEKNDDSFVIQHDAPLLDNDNLAGHVIEVEAEGQEPVKEKKKRQKQNISGEVNEIENNSNVESEKVEQVEKKKKRKHKSTSLERKDGSFVIQQDVSSLDDDNLAGHVIEVEAESQEPVKEKKKRHKKNISGEGNEIENNTDLELVKHVEKKKKRKHKSPSLQGNYNSIVVQHDVTLLDDDYIAVSDIKVEAEDQQFVPEKRKKHRKNYINIGDENNAIEHNANVKLEKVKSVQEKKKWKHKSTSLERNTESIVAQQDVTLLDAVCDIKVEARDQDPLPEKKKRHKKNSINNGSESNEIEQNTDVEWEKVNQVKERKKRKHKSIALERTDESIVVPDDVNMESEVEAPLSHRYNLSPNDEEDVVMQHITINKPANKKRSRNRKSLSLVAGDQGPVKEKKKWHKNNFIKILDGGNEIENHTDVETEKVEHVKERKKRKSTSLERNDESIEVQNDVNMESMNATPLNKRHRSKSFSKKIEEKSLMLGHNITEEYKENNKRHHYHKNSDRDEKISDSMLSSSDEESVDVSGSVQLIASHLDYDEEPVDFEVPLLHSCEKTIQISKEEREALMSKGVSIKLGSFSETENALLKRNLEDFEMRFGINDRHLLLGIGQKHRNKDVVTFLKAKHFYVRLAKGLNDRPLFNIYKKARLLCNPKNAKLSSTKVNKMKNVRQRLGNRWQEIGNAINRSATTTKSAFEWYEKESVNLGRWTAEEDKQLIEAIKTVWGVEDISEIELSGKWDEVAKLVPTRNLSQCRLHWFENLTRKHKQTPWGKKDYKQLVSILSRECYVQDYTLINWKEVEKCFDGPDWQFLRKKWFALKKMLRHENMNYKQMLDHYCVKYKIVK